ncbi:hypothetical protein [Nocardia noduli]|uniref:hypothetical protein n=1 Tax=Nocardia noduli TaxID=2815722 RepID=UPI001C22CD8B|nr:hypothetical protein [Nocardia noduli]
MARRYRDPTPCFAYIQQGGTSTEYYLHAFDTAAEAENGRRDCGQDVGGGFNTTRVVAIPALTSEQLDAIEELIQQLDNPHRAATAQDDPPVPNT